MSSSSVEGDWKNFTFKMLTPADFPLLAVHLRRSFYLDEPIGKIVGFTEKTGEDLDGLVISALGHNLSFAAYDKESGKMVGVRITQCQLQEEEEEELHFKSTEMPIILQFVMKTGGLVNIFEKYGVTKYADFFMASVDRECRGQGLATEMYNRSLTLLKEKGFVVAKTVCTNPFTRAAARKIGFEELGRCYFRELKDGNGEFISPHLDDEQCAALMVKMIV